MTTSTASVAVNDPAIRRPMIEDFMAIFGIWGLLLGLTNLIAVGLMWLFNLGTNTFVLRLFGGLYGETTIVLVVVQLLLIGIYLTPRIQQNWGLPEWVLTLCLLTSIFLAGWTMLDAFVGRFDWLASVLHPVLCVIGLGWFFGQNDSKAVSNYSDEFER